MPKTKKVYEFTVTTTCTIYLDEDQVKDETGMRVTMSDLRDMAFEKGRGQGVTDVTLTRIEELKVVEVKAKKGRGSY